MSMPDPQTKRDRLHPSLACRAGLLATALLCCSTGCSFVAVTAPPPDHAERVYFDCTTSKIAPIADLLGAGLFAASAAVPATSDSSYNQGDRISTMALLLGLTAVELAAAIQGWRATDRCVSAKQGLARRIEQQHSLAEQAAGCRVDIECKGERLCVAGACVDPPTPVAATLAPSPAAGAPPPSAAEPAPVTPAPQP
ncbi:MAG TPA: hypothetical protein VF331_09120 [Polyangiales bacterium]